MNDRSLAAVLIDFENVFYFLKDQLPSGAEVTDSIAEMLRTLKQHLLNSFGENILSMDAYADFDRIEETSQSALYLLGVETHNVLGTDHKNAADMRLCIDTLDILYNRSEIQTFVLVAGDRDYIPVIQYLKKRARTVRVVGFPMSVSGDLLTIVGSEFFIDATPFVTGLDRTQPDRSPKATAATPKPPRHALPVDTDGMMDWDKYENEALDVLFNHFNGKPEVWLTPFLNKLRAEISELTEWERKELISRLGAKGVFKVEKRVGTPNDFSVLVMNWNHPFVRRAYPGT